MDDPKNRARAIHNLRGHFPELADELENVIATAPPTKEDAAMIQRRRAFAAPLLAVFLGMNDAGLGKKAVERAAERAGLTDLFEADPEFARTTLREVKRDWTGVIEGRPEALARLAATSLGAGMIYFAMNPGRASPSSAGANARSWAQTVTELQGGESRRVHTDITFVLPGVKEPPPTE